MTDIEHCRGPISSDPRKACVPLTDHLPVVIERDKLRAENRDLHQRLDGGEEGAVDRAEQAALGVIDGYLAQFGIEYAESQYDGLHRDVTAAVLDALRGGGSA